MSRTRSGRVEEIFLLAIDRDPAEWRALLDQQCAGDKELRGEVETLLKCHADTDDFMDSKAAPGRGLMTQIGAAAAGDEELKLPPDGMIGRYRVIERIGSGGMGIVYLAEQDRPKRTVALKVMRMGQASARMLRRFEYEAEVLGRLHHPGIAQVYEAGAWTHEGVTRPFIAMELVRGHAIGKHCEEHKLGVRERLELIARVCDAVQHAHQAGVIHRDLKPGNIMIGEDGRTKLLDFGVARPLRNDLQLTTSMTGLGALIGTLPYMSPEQVLGDPDAIDTRSDVYAVGVILYELLSGRLPYDIRSRSLPEAARIIRDEEPAKLSGIDRVFRGEIETIVGQALEKDPGRRYQSAADLGEDIRRFLDGQPIHARNSSRWYVVAKQLQRHRGWVAAGAAALIGLFSFAVYASVQAQSERDARLDAVGNLAEAERQKKIARETSDRLTAELRVSTIENARLRSRTGDLAAAEDLLWREHLHDPASLHTFWGLWELYHDHSMIMAARVHESGAVVSSLSPDGTVLATGGVEGVVKLWRASGMQPLRSLPGHAASTRVTSVSYSPSGVVVSGGDDKQVLVHDPSTGSVVGTFTARSPVWCVACSGDGTRVAVTQEEGWLTLLKLPEATVVAEYKIESPAPMVAWDRGDARLALGGSDGVVRVLRPTGEVISRLTGHRDALTNQVRVVSFDPATGRLATSGRDRTIRMYPPDLSAQSGVVTSPNGALTDMPFTRDGRWLVAGGWWRLEVLDTATMQFSRSYTAPTSITSIELASDDRYAICGLASGEIRVWELARGGRHELAGHQGRVSGSFSRDGRLMATGDSSGVIRLWDAPTMRLLASWTGHAARVKSLVFLPSEDPRPWLITAGEDAALRVWDLSGEGMIHESRDVLEESCSAVDVSPDGRLIAYADRAGTLMVRDLSTWAQVAALPKRGYGYIAVKFSVDGATLYGSNRNRGLYAWTVPEFREIEPESPTEVGVQPWSVSCSTKGDVLAVSTWQKLIQLRDAKTLKVLHTLEGHTGLVSCVEFCPADPKLLVSTCSDGTVRLWDTSERRNVLLLKIGDANVEGITGRFSPDGRALMVCGSMGTAQVIDLSYYERAIANHVPIVLERMKRAQVTDDPKIERVRTWAKDVTAMPWPRIGPYATPSEEQRAYAERLERAWAGRAAPATR